MENQGTIGKGKGLCVHVYIYIYLYANANVAAHVICGVIAFLCMLQAL